MIVLFFSSFFVLFQLEKAGRGNLVISDWLDYFSDTVSQVQEITRCSSRTASRDLAPLVAKGAIIQLPGGGRVTRHELNTVESGGFGPGTR